MFGDSSDSEDDGEVVRAEANGVMQFHNGTEEAMLVYLKNKLNDELCVNIRAITSAIDEFCTIRHWMMHIGPTKSGILLDALRSTQKWNDTRHSMLCLELGSYCGYSSILIADELRKRDLSLSLRLASSVEVSGDTTTASPRIHSRLICIEPDAKCLQVSVSVS